MSLGPIDAERANPPELVGPTSRRRGSPREEIPNVNAPAPVGDALKEEKQDSDRHTWTDHKQHDDPPNEDHPIIDELA